MDGVIELQIEYILSHSEDDWDVNMYFSELSLFIVQVVCMVIKEIKIKLWFYCIIPSPYVLRLYHLLAVT